MIYKSLFSRPTPGCNLPSHSFAKQLPFSLLGEVKLKDKLHLEVNSPGLQYLYFLEQGLFVVGAGDFQIQIGQSEKEEVVGGKRYFFDLQDWLVFEPFPRRPHSLWQFLQRFNMVELYVRDQKSLMLHRTSKEKFRGS